MARNGFTERPSAILHPPPPHSVGTLYTLEPGPAARFPYTSWSGIPSPGPWIRDPQDRSTQRGESRYNELFAGLSPRWFERLDRTPAPGPRTTDYGPRHAT